MQVTIDRKKWQRGEGDGELYNSGTGKCCAVGFIALAAGLKEEEIDEKGALPSESRQYPILIPLLFDGKYPSRESKIETINDNEDLDDDEREERLGNVAREAGIELTFVG